MNLFYRQLNWQISTCRKRLNAAIGGFLASIEKPHRPNMIKVEVVFDFSYYSDSLFSWTTILGKEKIGPKHFMYFIKGLFPRNCLACRRGCEVNVRLKKYLNFFPDISYVIIGNEFDQRTLHHTTAKKWTNKVRQEFSRLKKVNIGFKKCHNSWNWSFYCPCQTSKLESLPIVKWKWDFIHISNWKA